MPKIVWPQQTETILIVSREHGGALPDRAQRFVQGPLPEVLSADAARAFLGCFYAARDVLRGVRDLANGGAQTDAFSQRALTRRLEEYRKRAEALERVLRTEDG